MARLSAGEEVLWASSRLRSAKPALGRRRAGCALFAPTASRHQEALPGRLLLFLTAEELHPCWSCCQAGGILCTPHLQREDLAVQPVHPHRAKDGERCS